MQTTSQAVPDANPASTSLAKCTRKNTRLTPTENAYTTAASTSGRCPRGGTNRHST